MKERKFISESVKKLLVTEFIRKETESAGFGGMEMKRTPFGTNITLYVNKPGLVIGRRGGKIQEITAALEKKFGVETPQIEVKEVPKPDLNPMIVSKKIAISLEKGWLYRKAGNTTLRRTIENDAKGVLIKIAGKISGERARSQKFLYGSVKYSGEPGRAGMAYGFSTAKLKQGIIGISVRILDPEYKLPDQIEINKNVTPVARAVPEVEIVQEAESVSVQDQTTTHQEEKRTEAPEKPEKKQKKETAKKESPKKEPRKKEPLKEEPAEEKAVKQEPKKTRTKTKKEPAKEEKKKAEPRETKAKKPAGKKKAEVENVGSEGEKAHADE